MPQYISLDIRFNAKVKRSDEGCWEWLGQKNTNGYGAIKLSRSRKATSAHRASYEMFCGPIPPKMCVLHTCDNPGCVRPSHLFLGSHADNSRDMALKERTGKSKLLREDAYAILWRDASGELRSKLAAEYGVTYQAIRALIRRETWPSLSQPHD
jgi:hypothetical protein